MQLNNPFQLSQSITQYLTSAAANGNLAVLAAGPVSTSPGVTQQAGYPNKAGAFQIAVPANCRPVAIIAINDSAFSVDGSLIFAADVGLTIQYGQITGDAGETGVLAFGTTDDNSGYDHDAPSTIYIDAGVSWNGATVSFIFIYDNLNNTGGTGYTEAQILIAQANGILAAKAVSGGVTIDKDGLATLHGGGITVFDALLDSMTNFLSTKVYTKAHGLGAIPTDALIKMICTATDGGYAVGDVMYFRGGSNGTVSADATNVYVATSGSSLTQSNKATGASFTMTASKWDVYVIAFK